MSVFTWMSYSPSSRYMVWDVGDLARDVYCSCCLRVGKDLLLKWMCCACMYALKVMSFKCDLFGHLVIVHLERLWSKCVHSESL